MFGGQRAAATRSVWRHRMGRLKWWREWTCVEDGECENSYSLKPGWGCVAVGDMRRWRPLKGTAVVVAGDGSRNVEAIGEQIVGGA